MSLLAKISVDTDERSARLAGIGLMLLVDLHVLVRRCAGQIHGRDLFGRAIAVAAGLRGADRAVADRSGGIAANSLGWNGRGCNCCGSMLSTLEVACVLPGDGLFAARRRHHLLSGLSDFRHRAVGDRAARACRLAALERDRDRLLRRADRAASVVADGQLAGADRARRQHVVRGADADHPLAARDAGYRAGVVAIRRHLPARRAVVADRLGDAEPRQPRRCSRPRAAFR